MLLSFLFLIATETATTDPMSAISGATGWVGAGLLGGVLAWLLWIHLPAKDKQIKEMIDSKDSQLKEILDNMDKKTKDFWDAANNERLNMLQLHSKEREIDRQARHEVASMFQVAIGDQNKGYLETIKQIEAQHRADAQADRDAFMHRNDNIKDAIAKQTAELRLELRDMVKGSCKWVQHYEEISKQNAVKTKDPRTHHQP